MITGFLVIDGWAGRTRQQVEVVRATRTRYEIRAIGRVRLAGRNRFLEPGQTAMVPKSAVRDNCAFCQGTRGGVPGNENIVHGQIACDYCSSDRPTAAQVQLGRKSRAEPTP